MNQYFSRVTTVIFIIMCTCFVSTPAKATENVPLPDFPELPPPGTELEGQSYLDLFKSDASIAQVRKQTYKRCEEAKLAANEASDLLLKIQNGQVSAYDDKYQRAYEYYMALREHCLHSTQRLNGLIAAQGNDDRGSELFDPTDPVTAQWAGTWSVRSKHDYGPARGGSYPSQFTVKIIWHGCEITWNNQEMFDCNVNGRKLTFWGFHNDDGKNRMDWTFFQSGLNLDGEFSGTIRGIPAGGTYTGEKAGY